MAQQKHGTLYECIGQRLRALRVARGMTQAEVAEIIGVSPQQYQKYEDAYTKCSLTNLATLATFYGVSVGVIVAPNDVAAEPLAREPDALLTRLMEAYFNLPEKMDKMRLVETLEMLRIMG